MVDTSFLPDRFDDVIERAVSAPKPIRLQCGGNGHYYLYDANGAYLGHAQCWDAEAEDRLYTAAGHAPRERREWTQAEIEDARAFQARIKAVGIHQALAKRHRERSGR